MMDRETLLRLAERCEGAEGPDACLDLEIFKAAGGCEYADIATLTDAPAYTASLDAAMKLAPEDCCFILSKNFVDSRANVLAKQPFREVGRCEHAATPALALCAAALRALGQSTL